MRERQLSVTGRSRHLSALIPHLSSAATSADSLRFPEEFQVRVDLSGAFTPISMGFNGFQWISLVSMGFHTFILKQHEDHHG